MLYIMCLILIIKSLDQKNKNACWGIYMSNKKYRNLNYCLESSFVLINYAFNYMFAEKIGGLIGKFGERRALTFEYIGLILVFIAYGLVENASVAAFLYVLASYFSSLRFQQLQL